MTRVIQNRIIFLIALIAIMGFLFYATAGFFLQDRLITAEVGLLLQKNIQKSGLKISIGRIHWAGINNITATKIVLKDVHNHSIPLQVEQIHLKLNLFALISNYQHPEALLREVELVNPRIKLQHFQNGAWNFTNYFPTQKGKQQLQMSLRIRNGFIEFQDYRYGRYILQRVTGKATINKFSLLTWAVKGVCDFNERMQWTSQGKCRIDYSAGMGELTADHVLVNKLSSFIPQINSYHISAGSANLKLKFAWDREGIWLENGTASLLDVTFALPRVKDPFVIRQLDAEFSPIQCEVKKAYLIHNRTVIKASGVINNKTNMIKAVLNAEQVDLEDLDHLYPIGKELSYQGEADLRLEIAGTMDNPIIDGELFVNNAQLMVAGQETVERISGRMAIRNNNLKIERLEGTWDDSLLGVNGSIFNLFDPRLDLKIYGSGLNLQPDEMTILNKLGLKTEGEINFVGAITGKPRSPKISSEISVEKLFYQEVLLNNLKLKLEWDGSTESLKVLEVTGNLLEGHLVAKGEVGINSKGLKWQISTKIEHLNLSKTSIGAEWGMAGDISSDMILKGNWRKGTPFQFGNVLGIFKSEKLAFKDIVAEEANGVFGWVDGNLNIDSIQAKIGQGELYGHLSWNPSQLVVSANTENIRIHYLSPDIKRYPFDGLFNGSFSFAGPPDDLVGKITGVFSELTWSGKQVGTIRGSLDYNKQGLNIDQVMVTTDMGDFNLTGRIDLADEPKLSLRIQSDDIQLNGLSKWLPVTSTFKVDGNAKINCTIEGLLGNPHVQGEVALTSPVFGPLQMEQGSLKVDGTFNELAITEFSLTNQDSQINITGKINQEQLDLNINGSALQLGMMQFVYGGKALNGIVDIHGKITGTPLNPVLTAQMTGRGLNFGTFYFQQLTAQITWNSQTFAIDSAQLRQDQTVVSLNGQIMTIKTPWLNLDLRVTALSLKDVLNNMVQLPAGFEADGELSGNMKIKGELNNPEIQITADLSQGIINTLPVTGEFDATYNNHQVNIGKFLLNQGTGTLLANGVWDTGRLVKVEIGLQDFPCQVINPFIDPAYKLVGVANAFVLLGWSNTGVSGEYRLVINDLLLNEYHLGELRINGNLSDQGLSVGEGTLSSKDGFFAAKGYIPWPPGLLQALKLTVVKDDTARKLNLALNFKNMPADLANLFFPDLTVLNGSLDGEFKLGGTLTEPTTIGKLDVNDFKCSIAGLPRTIESFQASLSFDGNKAIIKKAKGDYGQGKFNITGYAAYHGIELGYLNLGLTGSDIFYSNSYFDGYGDPNLKLSGPLEDSFLSGDINIFNSKIGVGANVKSKKNVGPVWDPNLLIVIHTKGNVRYRQVGLADVTVSGKVQVQGKLTEPKIEGDAISQQGTLTLYGQTFKVNQGKATFKFSQGYLPYIDVNSSLRSSKAEVFLTAKGQVGNDIAINLTSEPYMSRSDLFAMLNWPELNDQQKPLTVNDVVTGNVSFVTDTIFGDFLYQLSSALDMDYLYLEPNYQLSDLRINVGRNISKDLFLSYSRSFTYTSKDIWGLDYQINSRLSLGGNYSILDGTAWSLVYRFSF